MARSADGVGAVLLHDLPQRAGQLLRPRAGSGTSGGGGGGGVLRTWSSTHLPRLTGEVRVEFDVSVRMLAWVRMPPRLVGSFTRRNSLPRDAGDAVVPGQALVDEAEIGVEEIEHAAVLAQHGLEEQFGLADHRRAQLLVEVGKHLRVGVDVGQLPQRQPLPGEVLHEGRRLRGP